MEVLVDALIFQKDPFGGIARLYRQILPRMCNLEPDLKVTLFCDGPLRSPLPVHPQIQVRRAPPIRRTVRVQGRRRAFLYPFRRIASRLWIRGRALWMRDQRKAIWHSTFYTFPPSWEGPQVVTVHDMIHELYPDIYNDPLDEVARSQKRRCLAQASAVICVSETTRQDIERIYGPIRAETRVIYNGYNPGFRLLNPQENQPVGIPEPFLLYVGKRSHYKNFAGLLDVYRQWEGHAQTALAVVGAPWNPDEEQHLRQSGLAERVRLISQADDGMLCRLYNQAQAFIFPSLYEGFGIPILEAMACGCPVAAARIPSSLEIGGDSPFYFDPNKPGEFLEAIDQAVQTGREPGRVRQGLANIRRFSWEKTAAQTLEVYRSLDAV